MALVPSLWRDWWEDFERPHRLLDRHFGLALKRPDLVDGLALPWRFDDYFRPWRSLLEPTPIPAKVEIDPDDKFRLVLDVQQFSPNEILVRTVGNSIIIEARHEERKDPDGFVKREFMRRYDLPKGHDITRVMSNLSSDGVLTITAPKFSYLAPSERIVPIDRTRYPAIKNM